MPRSQKSHCRTPRIRKYPDQVPQCLSCKKFFKSFGGLNSHLTQKESCSWVLRERAAAPPTPRIDRVEDDLDWDIDDDENVDFFGSEDEDEYLTTDDEANDVEAECSNPRSRFQARVEDCGPQEPFLTNRGRSSPHAIIEKIVNDELFIDVDTTAGDIKGWGQVDHALFQSLSSHANRNPYHPFTNRMDWEIAR